MNDTEGKGIRGKNDKGWDGEREDVKNTILGVTCFLFVCYCFFLVSLFFSISFPKNWSDFRGYKFAEIFRKQS